MLKAIMVEFSQELLEVIDQIRDKRGRGPFMEDILRQSKKVKTAAEEAGITFIPRPLRGKYLRFTDDYEEEDYGD